MNRLFVLSACFFASISFMYGQNHTEVFTPSQNFYYGSARSQAMAGSFGSLGGDYISTSINPAGIGVYQSNEFAFTSNLKLDLANSSYLGSDDLGFKGNLAIDNISYVGSFNSSSEKGLVGINFAIGYNKLNDYHRKTNIMTEQATGSLLDELTFNANNGIIDYFWEDNAWFTDLLYLRDTNTGDVFYSSEEIEGINYLNKPGNTVFTNDFEMYNNQYGHYLGYNINESGRMGEFSLASALNISHKLYIGASLSIQNYRYNKKATNYEGTSLEEFAHNNFPDTLRLPYFENFTFTEDLYTSGRGFNGKIGAIFRPINLLRLGASFHTPTYMFLKSEYQTSMKANFYEWDALTTRTELNINEFAIKTPYKAIGSMGIHIGRMGVVNVDYEYIDYTSMKIYDIKQSSADKKDSFDDVNEDIKEIYRSVGNIRVGGEVRFEPLYVRLGYGYYPSPVKDDFGKTERSHYAGGIGFRLDNTFIDLTYMLNHANYRVYPYSGSPHASIDAYTHRLVATLGFRF